MFFLTSLEGEGQGAEVRAFTQVLHHAAVH